MWFFIAMFVFVVVGGIVSSLADDDPFLGAIWGGIVFLVVSFIIFLVAPISQTQQDYTKTLRSVGDTSSTDGSLFGFSTKEEFHAYVAIDGGGAKLESFPASTTTIYEDASIETASVVRWKDCSSDVLWVPSACTSSHYDIHVPPGSIRTDFNLDLE